MLWRLKFDFRKVKLFKASRTLRIVDANVRLLFTQSSGYMEQHEKATKVINFLVQRLNIVLGKQSPMPRISNSYAQNDQGLKRRQRQRILKEKFCVYHSWG